MFLYCNYKKDVKNADDSDRRHKLNMGKKQMLGLFEETKECQEKEEQI